MSAREITWGLNLAGVDGEALWADDDDLDDLPFYADDATEVDLAWARILELEEQLRRLRALGSTTFDPSLPGEELAERELDDLLLLNGRPPDGWQPTEPPTLEQPLVRRQPTASTGLSTRG